MRLFLIVAVLSVAGLLAACSKHSVAANPLADGVSIVVTDLPGDTAAGTAMDSDSTLLDFKPLYFSFTSNGVFAVADSGALLGRGWDLAFTGPFNALVYANSSANMFSPGYGGAGKGAVIQVDSSYEQVTTAPSDAAFDASPVANIGWDAGGGTGWFYYSLTNHICVPIPDRTFVLRTAAGKYAKLQLVNIYKGNPAVVTDLYWPAPYLTFRYYVQPDGGHDLRTK